mmetsp:Transcript_5886/g.7164  ORF Transcript_5886/g.7164 Transcript_5886/m.7164 type:complete len:599 (+) Transcript_5886:2757-4553(+)
MIERGLGDFLSWARKRGAFLDPRIDFRYDKQKGFKAIIDDCLSGEELIKVPKNIVIGPHLKEQYLPEIDIQFDSSFSNNEITILVISKLAFDASVRNSFKEYFEILPKNLNNPYFWNSGEIELVDGTDLEIILKRNFSKLVNEWRILLKQIVKDSPDETLKLQILQDIKFFDQNIAGIPLNSYSGELYEYLNSENKSWTSFRNYLWSYSILTSRGFPYMLLKDNITRDDLLKAILLPIIDLLNHKNDNKVKWKGLKESDGNHITFQNLETVDKLGELYNNYGNKSNLELLLGYGFVFENNKYDETNISLKVGSDEVIKEALRYKILINQSADEKECIREFKEGINFKITIDEGLPSNILNFFSILMQMGFEKDVGITLRMQLNGISYLKQIIEGKIQVLKKKITLGRQVRGDVYEMVKLYKNEQRKIFQNTLESLFKYEKKLLAHNKSKLISLKTILKHDAAFRSCLIEIFEVSSYEEILQKQIVNEVAILWIVTLCKNKVTLSKSTFNTSTDQIIHIYSQIEEVSKTIEVNDKDIDEYKPKVSPYISDVLKVWPDLFEDETNFIQKYVIADTVFDRLVYLRPANEELFLVQKFETFA